MTRSALARPAPHPRSHRPLCLVLTLGVLGCGEPSLIEALRVTPAPEVSVELPALPFARWVEEAMAPTPPRWREGACPGADCVEVWARHANGLSFGIEVVSRGGRFEIAALFLEIDGQRRHFDAVDAWAIAVAGLAPRSRFDAADARHLDRTPG